MPDHVIIGNDNAFVAPDNSRAGAHAAVLDLDQTAFDA